MEQKATLDKELIQNPRLWRLALRINEKKLHVVLFCSVEDNSLIYREIPLDSAAQSLQKAIEEAIYDNPLLLSDFDKVDCIIESDKFTVIPNEISDLKPFREYYGMSTKRAQKITGGDGNKTSEGISRPVEVKYPVNKLLDNVESYLRSCMTYTNSNTLSDLKNAEVVILGGSGDLSYRK